MAKLVNISKNEVIVRNVRTASTLLKRLVGLIGTKELTNSALWIPCCNSIHTFFMNFPIDLAFVDSDMNVVAVKEKVKPWRLVPPIFKAYGVFELPVGLAARINLGDVLHVDADPDR